MRTAKIKSTVFYIIVSLIVLAYFFIRLPELRHAFSVGTTAPYDFPQDYIAGSQLLAGKSLYPSNFRDMYTSLLSNGGITVDRRITHLNAHPPFTAMLLFPLWFLSFHNAIFLWGLLTILSALVISLLLITSEEIPWQYFPVLFLFILAWPPFQANLAVGQTSILVALLVIAGWYFFKKQKESISGIFIALATMLKFYPGLFMVYFLLNKKYKAFWSSIISTGIILVLVFVVTRHDFFRFIFHIMPVDAKYSGADIGNLSINGFFAKLFLSIKVYYNTGVFAASENYLLKNIFLFITVGLLLIYSALSMRKYTYDNDIGFSAFIIVSLLLSPICWNHYLTLILLPLIVFTKQLIKKSTSYEVIIFLTALFLISIDNGSIYFQKALTIAHAYIPGNTMSLFYRLTFFSAQFYGMGLFLYLNFRLIKKYTTNYQER